MKQLIRRLSKVADSSSSSSYALLRTESHTSPHPPAIRRGKRSPASGARRRSSKTVPSGYVPVYVGEEMERFVVSADLVNHPIFEKLLNKSAQEYGYAQKGALRIPCNVVVFERVIHALRCGDGDGDGDDVSVDVLDLIDSISLSSDEHLFLS